MKRIPRPVRFELKLTEQERADIRWAAEFAGMRDADYVRRACKESIQYDRTSKQEQEHEAQERQWRRDAWAKMEEERELRERRLSIPPSVRDYAA